MAEISKITIPNGETYDLKDKKAHFFGECTTAAYTPSKVVSITDFTVNDFVKGTMILVRFSNSNSASSPTLNINNFGAEAIYRYGTTPAGNSTETSWTGGSYVMLTYNGNGWVINNWLNDMTFFGTCTTAQSTVDKTTTIDGFTSSNLTTGTTIRIYFHYQNDAPSPTLNINNLGAKPICQYGTTGADTSWQKGSVIALTYDGMRWIINNWNNNPNLLHVNRYFSSHSAVYRNQLLFHTDPDYVTPLNNVANGYDTVDKTILTEVEFDPFDEIYYYDDIPQHAASGSSGLYGNLYYAHENVDLRFSLNISETVNPLTAYKNVYMKVIPTSGGKVKLAEAFPLVQTLPTTEDYFWYILLGRARSAYEMSLYPHHEVYTHNGSQVVQVLPQKDGIAAIKNISVTILANTGPGNTVNYNDSWITEDTACYGHDLATKNINTAISWEFHDGYVSFSVSDTITSNLSFKFGMIKNCQGAVGVPMDGTYKPPYQAPTYSYETTSVTLTDGSKIYVSRYENMVMLRINMTTKAAMSSWTTLGTLPAKYRPAEDVWFENALSTSSRIGFSVGTTGAIVSSAGIPSGTAIWGTVTYIAQTRY